MHAGHPGIFQFHILLLTSDCVCHVSRKMKADCPLKRDHFNRKGLSEQTIILKGLCEFSGVYILKNGKVLNLIKMFLIFSDGLKPLTYYTGNQTIQIYGKFQGFPLQQCIVLVGTGVSMEVSN